MQGMGDFLNEMAAMMNQNKSNVSSIFPFLLHYIYIEKLPQKIKKMGSTNFCCYNLVRDCVHSSIHKI